MNVLIKLLYALRWRRKSPGTDVLGLAPQHDELPLSIQPNPKTYVSDGSSVYDRLVELIERSNGGVFAITGVRGAGKSVLLQAVAARFQNRFHTVSLSAPTRSTIEMEFFMALFRLLCDSITRRLKRLLFRDEVDLAVQGRQVLQREFAILVAFAASATILIALFSAITATVYERNQIIAAADRYRAFLTDRIDHAERVIAETEDYEENLGRAKVRTHRVSLKDNAAALLARKTVLDDALKRYIEALRKSIAAVANSEVIVKSHMVFPGNSDLFELDRALYDAADAHRNAELALATATRNGPRLAPRPTYGDFLYDMPSALDRWYFTITSGWDLIRPALVAFIGGATLLFFTRFSWLLLRRRYVRTRHLSKNVAALGLLSESAKLGEYLDYELTRKQSGELSIPIPIFKDFAGKIQRGRELKMRSPSLPGLTAQYIAFVAQVLTVLNTKLVVCIDELDKVADVESVRTILREIKGGLYVSGCFYVISLSEDALQSFGSRLSTTRDIFESTFDEVFAIDRATVAECREIVAKRFSVTSPRDFGEDAAAIVTMCSVLSSGIPRDLIRNLRECLFSRLNGAITLRKCWSRLFDRKLAEIEADVLLNGRLDEVRAMLLESFEGLKTRDDDDGQDLQRLLSLIAVTQSQLATILERSPSEIEAADDRGFSAQSPLDAVAIKTWVRYCLELSIYVYSALLVEESRIDELRVEQLRRIYGVLPYSSQRAQRELDRLFSTTQREIAGR